MSAFDHTGFGARLARLREPMPRRVAKRRIAILGELTALSRNGWEHARPQQYLPLEAELGTIYRRYR